MFSHTLSQGDLVLIKRKSILHPYGYFDITDPNVFATAYSAQVDALTANGAKGVLVNIPDVTSLPYFTTVPPRSIPIRCCNSRCC